MEMVGSKIYGEGSAIGVWGLADLWLLKFALVSVVSGFLSSPIRTARQDSVFIQFSMFFLV